MLHWQVPVLVHAAVLTCQGLSTSADRYGRHLNCPLERCTYSEKLIDCNIIKHALRLIDTF